MKQSRPKTVQELSRLSAVAKKGWRTRRRMTPQECLVCDKPTLPNSWLCERHFNEAIHRPGGN